MGPYCGAMHFFKYGGCNPGLGLVIIPAMSDSFLTRHLRDADECYFEHLAFTVKVGGVLVASAVVIVIHGLLPFLFTHTGSKMLCRLNEDMTARRTHCEAKRAAKQASNSIQNP